MYPKRCLLDCGHEATMACSDDPDKFVCMVKVKVTLDCEHETMKNCHQLTCNIKCKVPCPIRVEPCGHACDQFCHVKDDPDHLTVIHSVYFLKINYLTYFFAVQM